MANGNNEELYKAIAHVLEQARKNAYRAINSAMVQAYWEIGRLIVEDEQQGERRAEYGKAVLKYLSVRLTEQFGKGFDESNLRYMRLFYSVFPIRDAVRHELTWTHYRLLLSVENEAARNYYLNEAVQSNWSTRALERQINSFYYERLLSSKQKKEVEEEMWIKTSPLAAQTFDFIKDPFVLEFLNLPSNTGYKEKDLETAIINNLQKFLLELGSGFTFVAQQQQIRTQTKDFFIDLVFYHFKLKCFVLLDLKLGELTPSGHRTNGYVCTHVQRFAKNRNR